jgi:hypothetical protein
MSEETQQQHNRRSYDTEVAVLKEKLKDFVEGTITWRKEYKDNQKEIINTQNIIISRLDRLPCEARKPMWDMVIRNIYALWGFIGLIIGCIVMEWIRRK